MQLDRALIAELLLQSVTAPRLAARRVLSVAGGYDLALTALALVAILSAFVSVALSGLTPTNGDPWMSYLLARPISLAAMQAVGLVVSAGLITVIGRAFGGKGRLDHAIALLAWFDFMALILQLAMLLVALAMPTFAGLAVLVVMALFTWLLANFIAELHRFESILATIAILIAAILLIGVLLVSLSSRM
jgi:hypothetical protein